ncbi:hypothetical protein BDV96DRAFT_613184 [Lophiotrema nucula]|uniref:BAG domain-containing protein n=1 Tax=Lophiotrema nucula TaxID=690887 RepID=A0A6A5Z4Z3_9PLEO|nr:hypothetical protein BDV96DRAFT_613184 [Lophiotrema nucula]
MARRSARLQKRSPTPSNASDSGSWETAHSGASPQPERLPSVVEGNEPASQTPRKPTVEKPQPATHLPQPSNAATPLKSKSSKSILSAFTTRTPKNATPIRPAGAEMHPEHYHMSTAKMLDEARELGFSNMGAYTAPPKASVGVTGGQATPSRTPGPGSMKKLTAMLPSPEFRFRFKSPLQDITPHSRRVLEQEAESSAGGRRLFGADAFNIAADVESPKRKIAPAKGKASRYSDVHMEQFKKMDSIANHPSAFRADPTRFKPVNTSLKRSPSKAELDKPEPTMKAPGTPLKRTQSKMAVAGSTPKIVPASLKRAQSKMDVTASGSKLPRTQSTVRMVPPTRDGRPPTQDGNNSPAKRVKRTENDDAASTRPVSRDGMGDVPKLATPGRPLHLQTGLRRATSRLMTPTKSSLARSQSVKTLKSTSMIPSLLRSPSGKNLFSPTNISATVREGIRKTSNSLHRVKSILRSPHRKFSEDLEKIAAGTHMSPPPGLNLEKALPDVPATAPVRKHVNFTTSTLERAAENELGKSPSPIKFRAGSEAPSGAVVYPALNPGVDYPALPEGDVSPIGSPSRRLTFGGNDVNLPGQFSFKSDKPINFGPASMGTIRMVRKSDASSLVGGQKRKLESVEESSDKENTKPDFEERSPKKMRTTMAEPPKTPQASSSKLPRRTPKRGSSLSNGVADFLSNPRLDDPTYLTTLGALLAAVFITMTWFSRGSGGGWGGRFSPFGRPGNVNSNSEVGEDNYSYITKEDLEELNVPKGHSRHRSTSRSHQPEIVDWAEDKNPDRDTDVLVFKNGRSNYSVHFPAQSIRDGELKVSTVRQAAAKKIGVDDPRRIRMFYKGRNLKHDERTAREEGLRGDGSGSEILCVVGEAGAGGMAPGSEDSGVPGQAGRSWSDDEDEDDTEDVSDSNSGIGGGKKKPRKRGGKKNRKKRGPSSAEASTTNLGYSKAAPTGAEFLPIPSHINAGPRPTSAPPANPPRPSAPQTPIGKMDAIASKFHTELVPLCVQFMNNPPDEKSKRDFEYKKLSETILAQVLLKLDGIETEGDPDARATRKALVKEVNAMLNKLDETQKH